MRVLVVDDDRDVRDAIVEILEQQGVETICAADGRAALAAAAFHRPDAILLDLVLPRMDGRAVLRALQARPALARIPVIVTTGEVAGPPDRGLTWLCKPFSSAELLRALQLPAFGCHEGPRQEPFAGAQR